MRKFSLVCVLSACALIVAIAAQPTAAAEQDGSETAAADKSDLAVHFSGARSDKGMMMISLFDRPEKFPDVAFRTAKSKIIKGQGTVTFKDLKPGAYAIAIAHDANNNGKMDKNSLGIPTEGYGFSNNAEASFGPPKFEAASISVSKRMTATNIEIKYFQ